MAKQQTQTTAPAQAPKAITVGKFTFAIKTDAVIPADIPKAPNPNAMFFAEAFSEMGHHQEIFVPAAWWTAPKSEGGRELEAEKVATFKQQKDRIKAQFDAWKAKDKEARKDHSIVQVWRTDAVEGYDQDGVSVFMVFPEALRPKPETDKK